MDRRTLLAALSIGGASLATQPWSNISIAQGLAPRRRRNVVTLDQNSPTLRTLRLAMSIMRGQDIGLPLTPYQRQILQQIATSGGDQSNHPFSLSVLADNHANRMSVIHNNWNFFPWHRAQLIFFESIVAHLTGDQSFAMPYWDYTEESGARMPDWLFQPPFAIARSIGIRNINFYREWERLGLARANMEERRFVVFGGGRPQAGWRSPGAVEAGTHNAVHRLVGGPMFPMITARSPIDPVFWLHHCSVDRAWASWQIRQGRVRYDNQTYPQEWAWPSLSNQFGLPQGIRVPINPANLSPAAVTAFPDAGYAYDSIITDGVFDSAGLTLSPPSGAVATLEQTLTLGTAPSQSLPPNSRAVRTIDSVLGFGAVTDGRASGLMWRALSDALLYLRIEGPELQDEILKLYIAGSADGAENSPIFLQTFVPVGMMHGHAADTLAHDEGVQPQAEPRTLLNINITQTLASLLAAQNNRRFKIVIERQPLSASGATPPDVRVSISVQATTTLYRVPG